VKENANRLEIQSPYGMKIYSGQFRLDKMRHYKIGIPLEDFKPVNSKDPKLKEDSKKSDNGTPPQYLSPQEQRIKAEISVQTQNKDERTPQSYPLPPEDNKKKRSYIKDVDEEDNVLDDTGKLLAEANRFYNQGKFYESLINVEAVLRERPNHVKARVMYGSLLWVLGQKPEAKAAWLQAEKLDPNSLWVKDIKKRFKE
jgi:tetratricopeptide (TPR) repeat protein